MERILYDVLLQLIMAEIKILINGSENTVIAKDGDNLLEILIEQGIFLPASCGGKGICNKCLVKVAEGEIKGEVKDGNVKSCRAEIIGDVKVEILQWEGGGLSQFAIRDYTIEKREGYGVAVDIGTTTIVLYLVNLASGNIIDAKSELNRQAVFGGDVLSRIRAAEEGKLARLTEIVRNQINSAIDKFLTKHTIKEIEKTVISGNTTMLHLLYGANPSPMGKAPFKAVFVDTTILNEGIKSKETILLPSSSAYIGSDIVAGILSSGMYEAKGKSLLIDIGTNGEMVLKDGEKLTACATAAGPAFEGGNIEKGMGGSSGAIEKVFLSDGKLAYSVIGGVEAEGICGSGLIDIIRLLQEEGIIDETGFMENDGKNTGLKGQLSDGRFYLDKDIYITQKDIREYQLGKSAIRSGMETLLYDAQLTPNDLTKVYISGGFGYYMNINNAIGTGLLPKDFKDKIINAGNTSGLGAVMCLVNPKNIEIAQEISRGIEITELSNHPQFIKSFIDNMSFNPEK